MLQEKRAHTSFFIAYGFMEEENEPVDAYDSLDEMPKTEREYVRRRLREELKREPTDEELDEWLRQQTEGY
ncbi:MAG: hypothetical protein DMF68_05675 [Acidobacteria bacterium]|nr:MAG: hypothetical protein DMF68_05675 [Acidobacteriota bacterium]